MNHPETINHQCKEAASLSLSLIEGYSTTFEEGSIQRQFSDNAPAALKCLKELASSQTITEHFSKDDTFAQSMKFHLETFKRLETPKEFFEEGLIPFSEAVIGCLEIFKQAQNDADKGKTDDQMMALQTVIGAEASAEKMWSQFFLNRS